jgi:hypothetical protein
LEAIILSLIVGLNLFGTAVFADCSLYKQAPSWCVNPNQSDQMGVVGMVDNQGLSRALLYSLL